MAISKQTARQTGRRINEPVYTSAMAADDDKNPYTQDELKKLAELEAGSMRAEIKHLDKRRSDKGVRYYTETKDEVIEEQSNWWEKFALIVTREFSDDNRNVISTTLQINSEHLKDLLRDTVKDYPGISFETKNISISAPYRVLYHCRPELTDAGARLEKDSDASRHFQLLQDFIDNAFSEEIEEMTNLLEEHRVTFPHLWTNFRPGSTIIGSRYGSMMAYKVLNCSYTCNPPGFSITSEYVDYDGERFGTRQCSRFIPAFSGSVSILGLPSVPQHLQDSATAARVQSALIARGKRFQGLAGMSFACYSGVALDTSGVGVKRVNVEGRVVVDCKTFHRICANDAFSVTSFPGDDTHSNAIEDGQMEKKEEKPVNLSEDQLLRSSSLVRGFAFTDKRWLDFDVDTLAPISWNESCFDQLVLPVSHKNIVRALVSDHVKATDKFDDIVEGKGKGLVLVLHGPPGVGKTLTAECVAEYTKRPLYIVSSGDLGTSSAVLDDRLTEILDIASTWKVVLLIDEADVFLEARTQADLERNALVSIFLRVLEYYQGIMFLTTNRVDTFDDAFKSRIHVPLKYSNLAPSSRRQIWANFLGRVDGGVTIDEAGYDALSTVPLNGRQIKNVIRTAKSLASYDDRKLDLEMLQQVVEIQLEFERDLDAKDVKPVELVNGTKANGVMGGP